MNVNRAAAMVDLDRQRVEVPRAHRAGRAQYQAGIRPRARSDRHPHAHIRSVPLATARGAGARPGASRQWYSNRLKTLKRQMHRRAGLLLLKHRLLLAR